jgi:predicted CXXCH cytochrome family protein
VRPTRAVVCIAGVAGALLLAGSVVVLGKGGVYTLTRHGDPGTGVVRTPDWPRGDCAQCHVAHDGASPNAFALFAPNTNALCYTSGCHNLSSANAIFQSIYDASATIRAVAGRGCHGGSAALPASGDWGKCVNRHDVTVTT